MAHPTIFILALASGISVISCRHVTDYHDVPDEGPRAIAEMTFRKPVEFTCPVIYGRYPHPESCEYFYECRFGWPTLMHCNRGYLYDRQHEQCRDWRTVKCHIGGGGIDHDRDQKDKDVQVKEDMKYFKCPYIWGTFAHPYDCSKYFVCIYNFPKLYQCNYNFLYDDTYRKCLPQNRVNCGKRLDRDQMRTSRKPTALTTTVRPAESTTTEVSVTTESHSKFYCPFPYGRYPDPVDCSRYYECRFSTPYPYVCPKSTLYDERKEKCFDEKHVKCGARPGGDDKGFEPEEDDRGNFRCPYIWGTFAHPVDCSKYIVCIYNVPSTFSCRKSELFHAYYRRCLPKEKVSCDNRINPDDPSSFVKTTYFPTFTTLTPSTMKKIPELTTASSETPTVITTTPSTTTTPVPTTASPSTTTTTTPVPTTVTPPTTTTTTPVPTTTTPTTTTAIPTTTTPRTTTTTTTTTPTTPVPTTTTSTTIAPTTTTSTPTTIIPSSPETTTQKFSTPLPVTKPNTPPPTDCEEDDLDCIIDGTGDVVKWFDCPRRFGHFPHGSSSQLFIHCDNWRPFVKKCAEETFFSPTYHVCVWADKRKGLQ